MAKYQITARQSVFYRGEIEAPSLAAAWALVNSKDFDLHNQVFEFDSAEMQIQNITARPSYSKIQPQDVMGLPEKTNV